MNTVKELAVKCRSIRRYKKGYTPSAEELTQIMDTVRLAPSAANRQRLKYTFITEGDAVKMRELVGIGAYLPECDLPRAEHAPSAYIVFLADKETPDTNLAIDIGIAAELLMLRAYEMGLGSLMIRKFDFEGVNALVDKEGLYPVLVMAIGQADETSRAVDMDDSGDIKYYHDENGVNIVPKRRLSDILV